MNKTIWKPLAGLLIFFALSTAQAANYKDDEIVALVATANIAEISAGKVAKSNAYKDKVKDFAEQMIKDHQAMDKQMGDLAVKLNLNPTPTDKSEAMKAEANNELEKLKIAPKGPIFDKEYVASQVKDHQKVLDMVNNELIPSAKNEQLKAALQKASKKIAAHLEHAKKLQAEVTASR
jgi:putative membrane protein